MYSDISQNSLIHSVEQQLRINTLAEFQNIANANAIQIGISCGSITYGSVMVEAIADRGTDEKTLLALRQSIIQKVYTQQFEVMGHKAVAFRLALKTSTAKVNSSTSNITHANATLTPAPTTTQTATTIRSQSTKLGDNIGLILGVALGVLITLTLCVTVVFRSMSRIPPGDKPQNSVPPNMRIHTVPGPVYAETAGKQQQLPPDGGHSQLMGQMWDDHGVRFGGRIGNQSPSGFVNAAYRKPQEMYHPSFNGMPSPEYTSSGILGDNYMTINNNSTFLGTPRDARGDAGYLALDDSKLHNTSHNAWGVSGMSPPHNSLDEYISLVPPMTADTNQDVYAKLEAAKVLVHEANRELHGQALGMPNPRNFLGDTTTVSHFYPGDSSLHANWNR